MLIVSVDNMQDFASIGKSVRKQNMQGWAVLKANIETSAFSAGAVRNGVPGPFFSY